ncbi:Golgin a7 [Mycena sanguinolenta]|uniref:Ras modification protein ERF4 n=1 Tax=Mycena sanguinolenta TaxID=230812 RepID=A0A8H6YY96_9AGAR|nr:Golgin a7 [Mycena sanguinolenta]
MSTAPPSPQDSSHPAVPLTPNAPSETIVAEPLQEVDITEREGAAGDGNGVALPPLKGDLEQDGRPQRESSIWPNDLPPSPPLTRPNTAESMSREKKPAGDDSFDLEGDPEFSMTLGEHAHATDSEVEMEPVKPKTTVVRQASAIQLDAKMEPQPWDLVDPPETNGQTNAEYYASLKGSKFNTLNSSRARALIPKSSYYFGPPPSDSAYGTRPIGQIGVHHPREILRVERDYTGGELIQFAPIYPLELEGRITPTQFLESINAINEVLISAHSLRHAFLDNMLSVFTLQLSRVLLTSHYEKEMQQLQLLIQGLNERVYNPVGLNILWPRKVAFLFMEIEYY